MNGTFIFNKDNWSGEEATIVVKGNEFNFYGYNFKLVAKTWDFNGQEMTDYEVHGDDWDEPLYEVRKDLDGGFFCNSDGIYRTNANPFVLAAIMAANTI